MFLTGWEFGLIPYISLSSHTSHPIIIPYSLIVFLFYFFPLHSHRSPIPLSFFFLFFFCFSPWDTHVPIFCLILTRFFPLLRRLPQWPTVPSPPLRFSAFSSFTPKTTTIDSPSFLDLFYFYFYLFYFGYPNTTSRDPGFSSSYFSSPIFSIFFSSLSSYSLPHDQRPPIFFFPIFHFCSLSKHPLAETTDPFLLFHFFYLLSSLLLLVLVLFLSFKNTINPHCRRRAPISRRRRAPISRRRRATVDRRTPLISSHSLIFPSHSLSIIIIINIIIIIIIIVIVIVIVILDLILIVIVVYEIWIIEWIWNLSFIN